MNPEVLPNEGNKDPFSDSFITVEEFSQALESLDEVCIMSRQSLAQGKKGEILSCAGSDGKFYLLLAKEEKMSYLATAGSLSEAHTKVGEFLKEIN